MIKPITVTFKIETTEVEKFLSAINPHIEFLKKEFHDPLKAKADAGDDFAKKQLQDFNAAAKELADAYGNMSAVFATLITEE